MKHNKVLLNKINNLDLEPIIFSLVEKEEGNNWSIEKAMSVEVQYREFLYLLCTFTEESIVPNGDIDDFWHTHILDTKKYFEDCDYLCGRYLHHFPYLGTRGKNDEIKLDISFQNTKNIYKSVFNKEFDSNSSYCDGSRQCGGDNTLTASYCDGSRQCGGDDNTVNLKKYERPKLSSYSEKGKIALTIQ